MICDEIRPLLPLHVYDDLTADTAGIVERHLAECAPCQSEHAALLQTRRALDLGPAVAVRIDPLELIRAETQRVLRRTRMWRRAAVTLSAVAAGLLLVLALRVQVRAGDGQFAITWGNVPAAPPVPVVQPTVDAGLVERLQLVQELTRALVSELESRDGATRGELTAVRNQLAATQRLIAEHWNETERNIATLYKGTFGRPESGEKQ